MTQHAIERKSDEQINWKTSIPFILVHVLLVLVSGVWNNLRSMVTGRYRVGAAGGSHG